MKGKRTLHIDGRDVPIRFDWGAVEDFCEAEDVNFSEFEKAISSPKKMRSLIWHMAKSGGSDITFDDLRKMDFSQMSVVSDLITESLNEGGGGKKKK